MPARIASGNSGHAATTQASSESVLQVSAGNYWARVGAGCRKPFDGISLEEPGSVRLIRWSRVRVPPRSLAKEPARTRLRPPIHLGCVNPIRIPDRARTRPDLTLHVCRALPVALPARYPMTPTWPPWWMHGPNCPRPSRPASWRWSRPPRGARNSRGLTGEIGASPPVAAGPFQHSPPKSVPVRI